MNNVGACEYLCHQTDKPENPPHPHRKIPHSWHLIVGWGFLRLFVGAGFLRLFIGGRNLGEPAPTDATNSELIPLNAWVGRVY
jgi:hypothetical protein